MLCLDEFVSRLQGLVAVTLRGEGSTQITRVATLEKAGAGDIAFLANPKYTAQLKQCRASAVIIPPDAVGLSSLPALVTSSPYVCFAYVAQWLNPTPPPIAGVHPTAVIESAVPKSVSVGAHAVIATDVEIGERVVIGAGCVVGTGVKLGEGTHLHPNVTLYPDCELGRNCIVHAGAVIGADGFGFAREADGTWVKIPQVGRVRIGDEVEIGANTTIDRGAIDDTVIASGVKIDNLVQLGHNVTVGEKSIIAGCAGIAGSAHIGARVLIGGGVGMAGHLSIADDAVISGGTNVFKTVSKPGVYTSIIPLQSHESWARNFAHLRRLDANFKDLSSRIQALETSTKDEPSP